MIIDSFIIEGFSNIEYPKSEVIRTQIKRLALLQAFRGTMHPLM